MATSLSDAKKALDDYLQTGTRESKGIIATVSYDFNEWLKAAASGGQRNLQEHVVGQFGQHYGQQLMASFNKWCDVKTALEDEIIRRTPKKK